MKIRNGTMKAGRCIPLLLLCIAVNFGGKLLAGALQLPVWMDMIGTCAAVYYLGLPYGILTALLNNALYGFIDSTSLIYALVGIVCAAVFDLCVRKGYTEKPSSMFFSSFLIAFSSAAVSVPLNLIFYGGYSGNMWGDTLFDMLTWYGMSKVPAAIAGETVIDVLDKQICLLICGALFFGAERMKKQKIKASAFFLPIALAVCFIMPETEVSAKTYNSRIYNNQSGMMSSEANAIAETADGYIWIGSYAGLTRYNGTDFEFITEGGIVSVTALMCDSGGRLWIGTNDRGIARYEDGRFTFFRTENGLPTNSVRCFCEGSGGEIYVGTTDRVCVFSENDEISVLNEDVYYINSMAFAGEYLICVGNDGRMYAVNENETYSVDCPDGSYFTCVSTTSIGNIAVSEQGTLYSLNVRDRTLLAEKKMTVPLKKIRCIEENSDGEIWICSDNGMGYIADGKYHSGDVKDFAISLEDIHEDYQGNLWIASSRYGVMCLSPTPFTNLFDDYDIPATVCNAVTPYGGGYCIGTDSGLILCGNTNSQATRELTEMLETARVRSVMTDSAGDLWICTYSEYGLVRMTKSGGISTYTAKENSLVTSDRARCITEMSDGTAAVGTADGIYFIKNGAVTGNITRADGLTNSQILSLAEGSDGTLYAGSDGAGLFLIRGGKIIGNYSTADGLSSDVILRIVPCEQGFLLITSNSLNLLSDGKITVLTEFPYYNNFDILYDGDRAYVLSSAGIFEANISEICSNEELAYSLYNADYGFKSAITANSWNFIDGDGTVYICCNDGVIRYRPEVKYSNMNYYVKYGIAEVTCDGERIYPEGGKYHIPKNAMNVTVSGNVRNFSLNGMKVKFYEAGSGIQSDVVPYSEIGPIRLNRPASGTHTIEFEVYDSSGKNLIDASRFYIVKEKQTWEKWWYRAYLIFMSAEIIVFIIWTFVLIIDDRRKKKALAQFNIELENKVAEQTSVIKKQKDQKEQLLSQTVFALANAVDAKDNYTSGHSKRVAEYAKLIAERMGKSAQEQEEIFRAGLLHDVGKIRIPEGIINKPGKLTDDEFALIKLHPITGYHILKGVAYEKIFADGARFHHERYDGKGYPIGLAGTQIPEIARIIGIADAYDAMASRRSYRDIMPQAAVRYEIEKNKGTQFDPEIADIMLTLIDEDKDYRMKETKPALKRILAVDDESINIKFITLTLKDMDYYSVTGVKSGTKAIEALQRSQYDIALIDLRMPDMDGYETAAKIREFSDIPIVLMTADRTSIDMEKMKQYNIADFITKPFMPSSLKEVLHAVLSE